MSQSPALFNLVWNSAIHSPSSVIKDPRLDSHHICTGAFWQTCGYLPRFRASTHRGQYGTCVNCKRLALGEALHDTEMVGIDRTSAELDMGNFFL